MPTIHSTPASEGVLPLQTEPVTRRTRSSFLIYLGLLAFLVAVNLLITFAPVSFIVSFQAATFAWPSLILVGAAGLAGLFLSTRTGFPDWWDARISPKGGCSYPPALAWEQGFCSW
jgi:hypothetical protein